MHQGFCCGAAIICSDNLALIQRYPELGIMKQTLTTMLMLSNCCFHFSSGGWGVCVCVIELRQTTLIWLSLLLKYSGPLLNREVFQTRGLSQTCFRFCCRFATCGKAGNIIQVLQQETVFQKNECAFPTLKHTVINTLWMKVFCTEM